MKGSSLWKWTMVTVLLVTVSLLSGCISNKDLQKPIADYLQNQYGITDFTIISKVNKFSESGTQNPVIDIAKPYPTRTRFSIVTSTMEIYDGTIFEDIFKSAYIAQFPEVIQQSDAIIAKYKFVSEEPKIGSDDIATAIPHIELNFHIDAQQKQQLVASFKASQTLDMKTIVPTLIRSQPGDGNIETQQAVVSFIYMFNKAEHTGDVPQATTIFDDFRKSGVLTAGIYQIRIKEVNIDKTTIDYGDYTQDTKVVFQVNANGDVNVLEPYEGR